MKKETLKKAFNIFLYALMILFFFFYKTSTGSDFLGSMFKQGFIFPQNEVRANFWFRHAAKLRD